MKEKYVPVLSVIETLLGLASEYQGCCADGEQLPSIHLQAEESGHEVMLSSGTNLIHKAIEYLQDEVPEYNPNEASDGSGFLPSDRKTLLTIKSLVDEMLAVK